MSNKQSKRIVEIDKSIVSISRNCKNDQCKTIILSAPTGPKPPIVRVGLKNFLKEFE